MSKNDVIMKRFYLLFVSNRNTGVSLSWAIQSYPDIFLFLIRYKNKKRIKEKILTCRPNGTKGIGHRMGPRRSYCQCWVQVRWERALPHCGTSHASVQVSACNTRTNKLLVRWLSRSSNFEKCHQKTHETNTNIQRKRKHKYIDKNT